MALVVAGATVETGGATSLGSSPRGRTAGAGGTQGLGNQSRRAPECRGYGRNPPPPPLLLPVAAVLGWVPSVTLTVVVLPERFTVRVTVSPGE